AVSSGSGVYRFIAVPAGEYQVVADLPEGYDVTLVPDESEDGALINEFSIDEDGRAAAAEIRVEDATTSQVGLGLVATAEDSAEPTTPTVPETTTTTAPPETTTTTLPSDVTVPPDTTTTTVAEEQLEAPDSGSVSSPTGITTAGEVEDYPIVSTDVSTEAASWDCTADGLLFQYPGNVSPTQIQRIDMVTGEATPHLELADVRVNAVGFNVLDGYVYGWNFDAPTGPVRIGADGTVLPLPLNGSVPQSTYLSGDVDENGHYWVTNQASGSWAQIDLATMEVIATGDVTGLDGFSAGPDWAYVPGGGDHLYRVMQHAASGNAHLIAFNRTTKQFEDRGSLGVVDTSHTFGAVYADSDGFLYLSSNNTGRIFRVDVHDVTATLCSEGPSSDFNDGTRCFDAPVPVDFGDAPDGYRTSLEFDGARHGMPGYDEASSTALVMLGALIDAEEDGQPSSGADGDDVDGLDDEDGVAFNPDLGYATNVLRTGLDPVSLQPIENTLVVEASAEGFVSVWVDWNQDGDFDDAGEQVANAESVDA